MEVEESPIVVECEDDVLRLERVLMKCMGCQGSACAFLESVPYRQVRMELLLRLRTGSSAVRPRVKVVVNASFVMDVTDAREVAVAPLGFRVGLLCMMLCMSRCAFYFGMGSRSPSRYARTRRASGGGRRSVFVCEVVGGVTRREYIYTPQRGARAR